MNPLNPYYSTTLGVFNRGSLMNTYSSTTLGMFNKCPQSLKFYEADRPYDRSIFNVGVATHAVLESIGKDKPKDVRKHSLEVAKYLARETRYFREHAEPPMPIEDALKGADLAIRFYEEHGLPENAEFEIELGMTDKGEPCSTDDDNCRYMARLDTMHHETIEVDDEYEVDSLVVSDWKTSWSTKAEDLNSLQMRGQAVLAWLHYGSDPMAVTRQLVSVQANRFFQETTMLDEDGENELKQWRDEILAACDAADKTRKARPGIGCASCKYAICCPDTQGQMIGETREEIAKQWLASKARTAALEALVKEASKECIIPVPGGIVGYRAEERAALSDNAISMVVDGASVADPSALAGLLKALGLGVGNMRSLAKRWFGRKQTDEREAWLDDVLDKQHVERFGAFSKED